MFKEVLETMNIKGNGKLELKQNLQKMSKNDIIARMRNTVQNIIQPAINDIRNFQKLTVLHFENSLQSIYGDIENFTNTYYKTGYWPDNFSDKKNRSL